MNIESPKSPESELPTYEKLSEEQKELLKSQFGCEDAETFEAVMKGEFSIAEEEFSFTAEEMKDYIKQMLENE
ncbi:MAG: hypothetical protein A2745_00510 [Candidatus Harrisonbacteria bacterium RIFCSPHIGHO2_01_FULL_44_13]|uniref:Uncharacterized protein n=1 Tax=Candidatus Harrisonbacteria bacterium RIFCSPLOWO2_01_FULL_44_18 TaxID=1798407 RepID=A0A1G1ZL76_9BACT|nr:MAG: hypothetical protein A2745_00510 [Candidatus Harrisonbacteria bacterium RIFCSPHIGHO2_01_FULL_44_13]OGY65304.1 MAG: hypothetical protein A3A16_01840 [Candidatus Harrisonbacteria bacterium RIFCSPLOWO2_01_FULL_44_18]